MDGKVIPIPSLLAALNSPCRGLVREAEPGEEPNFTQEFDKLCTGMVGVSHGRGYCFDLDPPVYLVAGRGYVILIDTDAKGNP